MSVPLARFQVSREDNQGDAPVDEDKGTHIYHDYRCHKRSKEEKQRSGQQQNTVEQIELPAFVAFFERNGCDDVFDGPV